MPSDLVFLMILVYFACLSGVVYSGVLILKPTKPWAACLAATIFIICVITLYASTIAFIEEISTELPSFKLAVGGEGFINKIQIN